ncbi:hypothetical protein [Priestia aryabhattai]|uniref:hypothetical protein n=1 Tax=Priestia aryabhattai TaxID=412384 RepID=UPI002E1D1E17|nr:hypothetical protein [Priestia aryabhattai]
MQVIKDFDFTKRDIIYSLEKENEHFETINYSSFILVNPITEIKFPDFDEPFFKRMDATLKHILYQYDLKWIRSERQVFYTSNECLTTIQFVFRPRRVQINVFQRSSNINNLKEDVQFLNWFSKENFPDKDIELNIFVSMPHIFTDRLTKVDGIEKI